MVTPKMIVTDIMKEMLGIDKEHIARGRYTEMMGQEIERKQDL